MKLQNAFQILFWSLLFLQGVIAGLPENLKSKAKGTINQYPQSHEELYGNYEMRLQALHGIPGQT